MFLALKQDIPLDTVTPLVQYDNKVSIANTGDFYLVSNVCPHQNSKIAKCATQHLQCPYHGLQFDLGGNGINNNHKLQTWKTYANQTMLFNQDVTYTFPIDTQYMKLAQHRADYVKASSSVIMDVFLDIKHIPVAHQGVYDQIGIRDVSELKCNTFKNGSVQLVPGQDINYQIPEDQAYGLGACWMAVYPGTMIEWQPGAMFITLAVDVDQGSRVQIYKYQDTRYDSEVFKLNNHVWETAWAQDRELSEMIVAPALSNLDALKQHYRDWMQHDL